MLEPLHNKHDNRCNTYILSVEEQASLMQIKTFFVFEFLLLIFEISSLKTKRQKNQAHQWTGLDLPIGTVGHWPRAHRYLGAH